jgi:hypothetical protein
MTTDPQTINAHPTSPNHNVMGKFALGNRASVGKGRGTKERELAVLEAINQVAPPERIAHAIDQMFLLAEEHGSWKAYNAAVTLSLAYQLGKPIARSEKVDGSDPISEALAKMKQMYIDAQQYTVIEE